MTEKSTFVVERVHFAAETWKPSLKGRAVVRFEGLVAFELEIIDGRKGIFIATPSRREQSGDGNATWLPLIDFLDPELEKAVALEAKKQFAALQAKQSVATPAYETQGHETQGNEGGADDEPF